MPLLCAVSSLEQQGPWRQPQEADCESSTLESWVRAGRQSGKSHGLGTDHGPAITASFDPHTAWEGRRSRLNHQRQTGAPGPTAALAGSYTGAQSGVAQDPPAFTSLHHHPENLPASLSPRHQPVPQPRRTS